MVELTVGQPVPDFVLPGSNGQDVSLKDYTGKMVVLYFYPQDNTPTCTDQACQFRDYNGRFHELGAEVIGISPDDLNAHHKFIAKQSLPFPLLADVNKEVCELYGVWQMKKLYGREYMGVVRSTFLIDEQGKLIQAWTKVRLKGHLDAILAAIEQHRQVDADRKASI